MQSDPGAPTPEGTVPLCVPEIGGNEWKYIKDCLDTNWVSSAGPYVDKFESVVADFVGAKHAVATVNGTAAIHIALLIAGVQPDEEVLVPTLTFIAPANAILYAGAKPVFMDVEESHWQMDPDKVANFLEKECEFRGDGLVNKGTGRRVRAIMPVHILGHPCDMDPILELAKKYNLVIVEDATETLGAKYGGRLIGQLGDVTCFSFNGNKLITTGGGGMIVTDRADLAERAKYLTTQAKDDAIEYVHDAVGYNYRLSNIQAAMGVAQVERLAEFIERKKVIAGRYDSAFFEMEEINILPTRPNTDPVYWLYTVLLSKDTTLEDRKAVVKKLNENGIGARPLWHTLHDLPPYAGCQAYQIEHAIRLYERGISLPSSVGLTEADQDRTIAILKDSVAG